MLNFMQVFNKFQEKDRIQYFPVFVSLILFSIMHLRQNKILKDSHTFRFLC